MTSQASRSPFLFGEDFRSIGKRRPDEPSPEAVAAQQEAERQAYARGVEEGRRQSLSLAETRLAQAVDSVAMQAGSALRRTDGLLASAEADGLAFFGALARKLAGQALADNRMAVVAEAAGNALLNLRGVPHVAIRVDESLVEATDALMKKMAREHGFEGRIIVLGDDHLGAGDARIEWADGGVVYDARAFGAAVSAALGGGAMPGTLPNGDDAS